MEIESIPGYKSFVWRSKKHLFILRLAVFGTTPDRFKISLYTLDISSLKESRPLYLKLQAKLE